MKENSKYNALVAFISLTNLLKVPVWISAEELKRCAKISDTFPLPNNLQYNYHANIGCWRLDYAACYGGYVIERMANEGGGISHPFGSQRRRAKEFIDCIHFFNSVEFYRQWEARKQSA